MTTDMPPLRGVTRRRSPVASARQLQLLAFIVAFKCAHDGCAPITREMMRAMDLLSTSAVSFHLRRLEALGFIRLGGKGEKRMIAVVGATWSPPASLVENKESYAPNPE